MSSKRSNEEQYSSISDHLGDKWTPPKCTMIEILQFCSSISKTQSVDTPSFGVFSTRNDD